MNKLTLVKKWKGFLSKTRLNRMVSRWEVFVVLLSVVVLRSCLGV